MYELVQVGEKTYYIDCPSKIGIFKLNDTDVCLIDSGNNRDTGKKIKRILDENGFNLKAIYNTHSHADHIGGNKYLQDNTGCRIFASSMECGFINNTVLEPSFVYGGFPPKDLKHKFLMAESSNAEVLNEDDMPEGMSIIKLPGHSFDMVGYKTCDDVIFLGDCLASRDTLEKYKVVVVYDVMKYIETLNMIKELKAKTFIPSHVDATDNISELAQFNIDSTFEVYNTITNICREAKIFDEILEGIFNHYSLKMSFEQYALVGNTLKSYLAALRDEGKIEFIFDNNKIYWVSSSCLV